MTAPPEKSQDDRDNALLRERQAALSITPEARETARYLAMRWQARADDDAAKREPPLADTLEQKGLSVPDFRFYCLSDQNRIVFGETLCVLDLEAAIQAAYRTCHDHPHFPSSRIEVWQGTSRLFSSRDQRQPQLAAT
jgi:hypothetical protein